MNEQDEIDFDSIEFILREPTANFSLYKLMNVEASFFKERSSVWFVNVLPLLAEKPLLKIESDSNGK